MPETLDQLVMTRRVLVTVGAGGVGKTTTAAALGVAAASRGRRVLCLTIDPARRLAEALGLERMSGDEQAIAPALFEAVDLPMKGSLTAMMLDTKRTFDELVLKYSSSPDRAQKLLANKLYQYVSTSLAGTQEYMAMEKLVAVQRDPRFDLVILDTPPTTNALDFLDAPGRLVEAVDSPTMRWFVQAFESTGKVGFNLLARSAAVVLRGLGRITGGGFLAAMAEFITELNDLFGGFKQRAQMVENSLRSPEVSFVVVASPAPVSLEEAVFFSERLGRANMPRGAFVVNRFRLPPLWTDRPPSAGDAAKAIAAHGLHLEEDAPERVVRAHADAVRLAKRDAANVRSLGERASDEVPIVRVPELASDVHDLKNLRDIAEMLMSGGV
ncbi:MAG TPA: ArsA-related P-loop ATPase [Polyangiaceae bacterium]|jgi:anion-transporting  ArsA/GET3 family ATPase|nr:ArsA-related P-loop ATPase [Polyangiaceae bacterium]